MTRRGDQMPPAKQTKKENKASYLGWSGRMHVVKNADDLAGQMGEMSHMCTLAGCFECLRLLCSTAWANDPRDKPMSKEEVAKPRQKGRKIELNFD